MFYNHMTQSYQSDAVELLEDRSWYIKMGFAGFNCSANNYGGFPTRDRAEAAIRRYQK